MFAFIRYKLRNFNLALLLCVLALCILGYMVLGSAVLLQKTGEHPAVLVDKVCSPGGTTIEGLHRLRELGFEHSVYEAIAAVIEKDKSLGS